MTVRNTGSVAGAEAVQAHVGEPIAVSGSSRSLRVTALYT